MFNTFLVTRFNVTNDALIHELINLFIHRKLPFLMRFKERERGGVHSWYGVATVSRIDKIRARGGEAHCAEAAARHQGRSK